jgi:hypothetical protein
MGAVMLDEVRELLAENFGTDILPVQYWTSLKTHKAVEGERRLWLAVLEDAVRCYLANRNPRDAQQRMVFAEARDWFYPRRNVPHHAPVSFEDVCDELGIDAEAFRGRLNSINVRDLPTHRRPVCRSLITEQGRKGGQRSTRLGGQHTDGRRSGPS